MTAKSQRLGAAFAFCAAACCAAAQTPSALAPCLTPEADETAYVGAFEAIGWQHPEADALMQASKAASEISVVTKFFMARPDSLASMPEFLRRAQAEAEQLAAFSSFLVNEKSALMISARDVGDGVVQVNCMLVARALPWVKDAVAGASGDASDNLAFSYVILDPPPGIAAPRQLSVSAISLTLPLGGRSMLAGGDALVLSALHAPQDLDRASEQMDQ